MNSLRIVSLSRSGGSGEESLQFTTGVNLIVGPPNTGKTKWLQTLDYLFADPGTPEDTLGDVLASKYTQASAILSIGNEDLHIERRWTEAGNRGKIIVNDHPMLASEFSDLLLAKLEMPAIRFPLGQKWPQIGWRTLLRHIYRQQRFWTDIADKQPRPEQHACLMLLLGLAEHLFPQARADLTVAQERRMELDADRRRFVQVLDDVSAELLDTPRGTAITDEVLQRSIRVAEDNRDRLLVERAQMVHAVVESVRQREQARASELDELEVEWAEAQKLSERYAETLRAQEERLSEIRGYEKTVEGELARLNRAIAAGESLTPLKVTRCPVCEQSVANRPDNETQCFLCGQSLPARSKGRPDRLAVEVDRLKSELDEAQQLIRQLSAEHEVIAKNRSITRERLTMLEARLRPYRTAGAAIVPPELSSIDVQTGVLEERIRHLNRLRTTLRRRDELAAQIKALDERIGELQQTIVGHEAHADFVAAADALTNGMNEFVNLLNDASPGAWNQGRIDATLVSNGFEFFVGNGRWSNKLGGTMTLYFLLAYHFGLLRLSGDPLRRYPGLSIIDLPPQLDEAAVVEMEGFIVQPFLALLRSPEHAGTQLILTGSTFEGVEGVTRIPLDHVWT